jgi:hypothetical protein
MSEYQYYEFQAIDRSLTEEEQQAVAGLSSRVSPHPRQAVFVYNWGSFPANSEEILARYYDAMLYMANWGSRQLMFRFPRSALNVEAVQAYCQPLIVEDYVSLSTVGDYSILNVEFHDEEGGMEWVEGEGWLPTMLSLRDDILRSDYRTLYLAWLKVMEVEDLLHSVPEPPVPPGLQALSAALRTFVDFFEIDPVLVQVAAEASGERQAPTEDWLRRALSRLPGDERDEYLLRLARGEAFLSVELNRRLQQLLPLPESQMPPRRTVGQLITESEARQERERIRRAEEAEARRIHELEVLAKREAQTWEEIEALIQQTNARAYDEAVQLLVRLRDLARCRGKEPAFQQRVDAICQQYSRRPAFLSRLGEAGLCRL